MDQKQAEYHYHLKQIADICKELGPLIEKEEYLKKELDKSKEFVKMYEKEKYND